MVSSARSGRRRAWRLASAATLLICGTLLVPTSASADEVRDGQWYLGSMGITAAQSITRGEGVKVAVIDSGVDGSARDLKGAVVDGKDFSGVGSPNGQQPIERDPHGTNVASLLAARGYDGGRSGVIGVAPGAQLLSASINAVAPSSGDQLAAAVRWSVDHGAKVINLSLVGGAGKPELAAFADAQSKDVVIVAGAGNNGARSLTAPCSLAGVVCVGGVDRDLKHDPKSNTGPRMSIVGTYATVAGAADTSNPRAGLPVVEPANSQDFYSGRNGTSLATPVVAGAIALIRARYPQLDAANVINRLLRTATPAGDGRPNESYGWGIVNADRALTATVTAVKSNPLGSLSSATTSPTPNSAPIQSEASTTPPLADGGNASGGVSGGLVAGIVISAIVIVGALIAMFTRRASRSKSTKWSAASAQGPPAGGSRGP